MGRTRKVGAAGSLKARYGSTLRKRHNEVITEMRRRHRCPQCDVPTVKRQSIGIWKCRKCGFTFTGGAYTPSTKLGVTAKRVAKSLS